MEKLNDMLQWFKFVIYMVMKSELSSEDRVHAMFELARTYQKSSIGIRMGMGVFYASRDKVRKTMLPTKVSGMEKYLLKLEKLVLSHQMSTFTAQKRWLKTCKKYDIVNSHGAWIDEVITHYNSVFYDVKDDEYDGTGYETLGYDDEGFRIKAEKNKADFSDAEDEEPTVQQDTLTESVFELDDIIKRIKALDGGKMNAYLFELARFLRLTTKEDVIATLKESELLVLTNPKGFKVMEAQSEYKDADASSSIFHMADAMPMCDHNLEAMPFGSIGKNLVHLRKQRMEWAFSEMVYGDFDKVADKYKLYSDNKYDYRKQVLNEKGNAKVILQGLMLTIADELELDMANYMTPEWLNILKHEKASAQEVQWAMMEVNAIDCNDSVYDD